MAVTQTTKHKLESQVNLTELTVLSFWEFLIVAAPLLGWLKDDYIETNHWPRQKQ